MSITASWTLLRTEMTDCRRPNSKVDRAHARRNCRLVRHRKPHSWTDAFWGETNGQGASNCRYRSWCPTAASQPDQCRCGPDLRVLGLGCIFRIRYEGSRADVACWTSRLREWGVTELEGLPAWNNGSSLGGGISERTEG